MSEKDETQRASVRIMTRVTPAEAAYLDRQAAAAGRSRASIMTEALRRAGWLPEATPKKKGKGKKDEL